jgi:hypothetical protein
VTAVLADRPLYDLGPIKNAYANFEFERADELIEDALAELLTHGGPEQLARGAAELLYWRGLVAAGDDRSDEAITWFTGAFRAAPDLEVDGETASPNVRSLISSARKSRPPLRPLYLDGSALDDPEAELAIDGGTPRPIEDQVDVAIGLHLVVVTAPKKKPFATLVDVRGGRDNGLTVDLDDEDDVARARRLRAETLSARSSDSRWRRARRLAKLTGARRLLIIDGDTDVRVYDAVDDSVSSPMPLSRAAQPSVLAALLGVDSGAAEASPAWHKRWYVWAAIGAVAAGASVGIYAYSQREPSRLEGF